jgi:2-polyprenyl-3-methyl-5-hydroxy-6-metoxy-1,4-benzoquinol methylase
MVLAFEKNSCRIVRCPSCGFGRTWPAESFDPREFYQESYFQAGVADGYADYVGSEAILRLEFRHALADLLQLGVGRERLLEFGCAYGFFLDEAKPYFQNVHGIEISAAAAAACRARGLDVACGEVDGSTLNGPYDVAVGLDVIEHVPDPFETLKAIGSHMRAGGVLVITTGDWSALLARVSGPSWRLMTPPQHQSFFSPTSMRLMFERAGLSMKSLTHPWKRVPLSLVAYQLQRLLGMTPQNIEFLSRFWVPINLWDAMRVVAVKK